MRKTLLLSAAAGALTLPAAAPASPVFTIRQLLREGDAIPKVGSVTSIAGVAINNAGVSLIEVDTDNPDTNADSALLRDGLLLLREGQALAQPAGATLDSFDSLTLNNAGDSAWNFFLDGPPTNQDSGVYFNTTLLIQESDISAAAGFSPATPYIGFFDVKLNDNDQLLLVASVDDPAIPTTVDRALVRVDYDRDTGTFTETLIAKEGDILPGASLPVVDFGTESHRSAISDDGGVMFIAEVAGGTQDAIYINNALIAREGAPSPIAGRNWEILSSSALDLCADGPLSCAAFTGNLDGDAATDSVLLQRFGDGAFATVAREGATLPPISPFLIESFGTGPVFVADGDVFWYGEWSDPDTERDSGLFCNEFLLIQEGVTTLDGAVIDTIRGIQDGFALSDNARFLIVRVVLVGGLEAVALVTFAGDCVADFDADGDVDIQDLLAFLNAFASGDPRADIDSSGTINIADFLAYLNLFNKGCP